MLRNPKSKFGRAAPCAAVTLARAAATRCAPLRLRFSSHCRIVSLAVSRGINRDVAWKGGKGDVLRPKMA
jgi:hypothetical protein